MANVPITVLKEQYLLRSTFFYNRLNTEGYFNLFKTIQKFARIEGNKFSWDSRSEWSISEDAWKIVKDSKISPLLVFLHPKVLNLYPSYLKFYRSVCMISQKGLQGISKISSINRIEEGKVEAGNLNTDTISKLVSSINEIMSAVIALTSGINLNEIQGMMYATAGTKIDGSWRNQIGSEGERVIRSIIFRELLNHQEISSVVDKSYIPYAIQECNTDEIINNIDVL